ncbi:MAG: hypothetical protein O7D95_06125 [Betaproteobacteria bacterium]|nr:hypothetical protein [Betaproteobacteria bacterium]
MKIPELIKKLKSLPQDKEIMCQVVGENSGAWNMPFDFKDIDRSGFIQLQVYHPDLKELPMGDDIFGDKPDFPTKGDNFTTEFKFIPGEVIE